MSGGMWDYDQYKLDNIIGGIEESIGDDDDDDDEYLEENIDNHLRRCIHHLNMARIIMHRVDWLYSGDDGYETFEKRMKEDFEEYMESIENEKW